MGPGTGAVTQQIVKRMRPGDELDLVEINPAFVEVLNHRLKRDPGLRGVADRARVICSPVERLEPETPYDVVISGLPLNNFPVAAVEEILHAQRRLTRPGGTLSFFEYIAIRSAKTVVSPRPERERLKGVGRVLEDFLALAARREAVWINLPPAWVHHVRFPARA